MKRKTLVGLVVAATIALGGGVVLAQNWGYGGGWGHMMGAWGPGYGGYGYMMGPGYGNYCWGNNSGAYGETTPLTQKDTEAILRNYIGTNPNLKVGKIKDKGSFFEGEIVTKENSLVAKLGVDKDSGWVRPLQ
jgi:hypothetical protein